MKISFLHWFKLWLQCHGNDCPIWKNCQVMSVEDYPKLDILFSIGGMAPLCSWTTGEFHYFIFNTHHSQSVEANLVMLPARIKCKAVNLSSNWDLDSYVLYQIALRILSDIRLSATVNKLLGKLFIFGFVFSTDTFLLWTWHQPSSLKLICQHYSFVCSPFPRATGTHLRSVELGLSFLLDDSSEQGQEYSLVRLEEPFFVLLSYSAHVEGD